MAEGGGPACGGGQQPPPPVVPQQQMCMNWSHFKPEFSGKPDEDVEAHLLRTNDWMTTHDTREQLFHACRLFHYDENVETANAYVIRIKQDMKIHKY